MWKPVQVHRLNECVLQVKMDGGIPVELERGQKNSFCVGERIALDGMTVIISAPGPQGNPTAVCFEFDNSRNSASFKGSRAQGNELVP